MNWNWLRFVDLGVYLALAAVVAVRWHNDWPHRIGAAISVPAFVLWMLARRQLGEAFAVRAEAKNLVTHGMYSKIRIPFIFSAASPSWELSWRSAGMFGP